MLEAFFKKAYRQPSGLAHMFHYTVEGGYCEIAYKYCFMLLSMVSGLLSIAGSLDNSS
ncbi:MAG: hypothetical protein QW506_00865 [Thermoproteota archaeon]